MGAVGVCDADVDQVCQKASNQVQNKGIWSIGAVGRCLSRQLAERKTLTSQCQTLVAVAAPKVNSQADQPQPDRPGGKAAKNVLVDPGLTSCVPST